MSTRRSRPGDFRPPPVDGQVRVALPPQLKVTISGSFTKHLAQIESDMNDFRELGAKVLSPPTADVHSAHRGFTYLRGDPSKDKRTTEDRHLDAIHHSDLLWVVSPKGYLGRSAAFELGFAAACGVPIFGRDRPDDATLELYLQRTEKPRDALRLCKPKEVSTTLLLDPPSALGAIENELAGIQLALASATPPYDTRTAMKVRAHAQSLRGYLGTLANLPDVNE